MKKVLFYAVLLLAFTLNTYASDKIRIINSGENEHLLNMLENTYWVKKGNTSDKKVYVFCAIGCSRCQKFETTMKSYKDKGEDVEFRVLYTGDVSLDTEDQQLRERMLDYNSDVLAYINTYVGELPNSWMTPIAIIPAEEGILYTAVEVFNEDEFTYESFKTLKNRIIPTKNKKYQEVSNYIEGGIIISQGKLPVNKYVNSGGSKVVYTYPSENSAAYTVKGGKYTLDSNYVMPFEGVVLSERPEWIKVALESNNLYGYLKDPIFAEAVSQEYEMVRPAEKQYAAKIRTEIKRLPSMKTKTIHVLNPGFQFPQVALLQRNGRTQWIKVELNKDYYGYINVGADSGAGKDYYGNSTGIVKDSSRPRETERIAQIEQGSSRPRETERIAKKKKRKSLFGGISKVFKFKINGKEVDLAEKLGLKEKQGPDSGNPPVQSQRRVDSRYPPTQSQQRVDSWNSSSKGVTAPNNVAVKREIAKRVAGRGPIGPDVTGLRIGMTPDDVRAIFKARGFRAPNEVFKGSLAGKSSDGKFSATLKEKSLESMLGDQIYKTKDEMITVNFTPDPPGYERVMTITRIISQPRGGPTFDSFDRTVIEKYGTPTYSKTQKSSRTNSISSKRYFWVFDSNGSLQRPYLFQESDYDICGGNYTVIGRRGIYAESMDSIQRMHDKVSPQCGNINIQMYVSVRNMLVNNYSTYMQGYDEFFRSALAARARANTYAESEYNKTIKSGEMVTPDL